MSILILILAGLAFGGDLADPKLTPGATVNVSLKKLCQKGYATSVRDVPESDKRKVYEEYGIKNPAPGEFEIDHLISLEIAGSNAIENLWPQSYLTKPWNAHVKDALEDRLHAMVCAPNPRITLDVAQQMIRVDWIAAYKEIFKTAAPLK